MAKTGHTDRFSILVEQQIASMLLRLPLLLLGALVQLSLQAQLPWVRTVPLEKAYHFESKDGRGRLQHDFLLFYENDSVISVLMADHEMAWNFDHTKKPKHLLRDFIEEYHCEPDGHEGVYVYHLSASSLNQIYGGQLYSMELTMRPDGTALILYGNVYDLIKRWGYTVHPKRKVPRGTSGCAGEEIQ